MGTNVSGKSTLAQVLARREAYNVTSGQILYNGKDSVMIVSINPPDVRYPSKQEMEIFYDTFNELVKRLPDILKSNFP